MPTACMRADQLVDSVLGHPGGGVKGLLELTDSQEVDWLEFKASSCDQLGPGAESTLDLQWRIARAVIAMVNSRGGCVIVGVGDDGKPVGIAQSDPQDQIGRYGDDYFLRHSVVERVLQPSKGWKSKDGRLTCDRVLPDACAEVRLARYSSERVILIIVHPLEIGVPLLRVVNEDSAREFVPVRKPGYIGCIRELFKSQEINDHFAQRSLESPEFTACWERFKAKLESPALALEEEIKAYHSEVKVRLARLAQEFTLLEGNEKDENKADVDLLIPEADEVSRWLDPDDAWAMPDSEESLNSEAISGAPRTQPHSHRRGSILDLLRDEPRAMVLGRPGSGKTTCLQRLALACATEYTTGGIVSIFTALALYRASGLFPLLRRVSNISVANLEHLARSRRLCLILDGLNECPAELAGSCASEIGSVLARYPDLRLVLSSRTTRYSADLALPTFEILPLSYEQQLKFLETRLRDPDRAARLLGQLTQAPASASFASNPQLLSVASQVARVSDEVPNGQAKLYAAYISKWFEREERKALSSQEPLPWSSDTATGALSALAFKMRLGGRVACDLEFVRQALEGVVADPMYLIDRLAQGLLFILDRTQGTFGFEHETIQEFLCALHFAAQPRSIPEAMARRADCDLWTMPIAFLFELVTPTAQVLKCLWTFEPLLTAAAIRSESDLANLDVNGCGDPWARGIIRSFRREAVTETRALREKLLSNPSRAVRQALRSDAFWYASLTHPAGVDRIGRLRALISKDHEPWADLLTDAFVGNPDWTQEWCDAEGRFLLVCSGVDDLAGYATARQAPPSDIPYSLVARLVYQRRIPQDVWSATAWLRRLFFKGPWFQIPTLLSPRQWKIALNRGAIGFPPKRRSLSPQLVFQLSSMRLLLPTLARMGIIEADEKALRLIRDECLPYLETRDIEYLAQRGLIRRSDISDSILNNWTDRASATVMAELVAARIAEAEVVLTKAKDKWSIPKQVAFLKRLLELEVLSERAFTKEVVRACAPLMDATVRAGQGEVLGSEALPGIHISEAAAAIQMEIADSFDLTYLLASANLLSAVANRMRKTNAVGAGQTFLLIDAVKKRVARELLNAASNRMDGIEIHFGEEFTYAKAYGVQFSFKGLPVEGFVQDLSSRGLNSSQEWCGRRLQPIARSVLDWARQLRIERRDIGSAELVAKAVATGSELSAEDAPTGS